MSFYFSIRIKLWLDKTIVKSVIFFGYHNYPNVKANEFLQTLPNILRFMKIWYWVEIDDNWKIYPKPGFWFSFVSYMFWFENTRLIVSFVFSKMVFRSNIVSITRICKSSSYAWLEIFRGNNIYIFMAYVMILISSSCSEI